MALSTYLANKLLDHSLGRTAYSMPTTYLALYTVAPTAAGGGTECAYTGYARQALGTGGSSELDAAASGATTNAGEIIFPTKTAGADETVVAFGILDASAAGNLLHFGTFAASKLIEDGDAPRIEAGELDFSGS